MTSSCSTLPASSRSPANHFEISTILLNTWIQLVMNGVSLPSEDHRWFQLSPNSQTWKEHYEPYDELLRVNHVYNWHNVTTWKVCKIIKSTFAWNICTFQTCCSFWFLPFDDFPVLSLLPSQCCPTPRDPRRLSHWTFSSLISDHSKALGMVCCMHWTETSCYEPSQKVQMSYPFRIQGGPTNQILQVSPGFSRTPGWH